MTIEPRWLAKSEIVELHEYVLALTGGAAGIRDDGLLGSALARPLNKWNYEGVQDVRDLAAAYGFALAKNHPFVDGNKRAAFLALGLFLELNGYQLSASDKQATATMLKLAASEIDEAVLAVWVRDHTAPT